MAKPEKEIYTFTGLLLKAARLFKSDPVEYCKMFNAGTEKLIDGLKVYACGYSNSQSGIHEFYLNYGNDRIATINGVSEAGKNYTRYSFDFRLSIYKKSFARWLPITLPNGVGYRNPKEALYHNADGSFAVGGRFTYRRRGGCGVVLLANYGSVSRAVYLEDKSGKFVETPPPRFFSGTADPVDLMAGFLPGTVKAADWYESMNSPVLQDGERLWNSPRVKMAAALAHKEALNMKAKYPHLKIALYPACKYQDDKAKVLDGSRFGLANDELALTHCLARDSDGDGLFYYLPRLAIYWTISAGKTSCGDAYGHFSRSIEVVVPPYGNSLLKAPAPGASPMDETIRNAKESTGRRQYPLERCFHTVRAFKEETKAQRFAHYQTFKLNQEASSFVYWPDHTALSVIVSDQSDDEGQVFAPRVCNPKDICAGIVERELLDSLPLC